MAAIQSSIFWARAFLTLLATTALVQSLSAQTLEANPEFDVGDKWTYRYQNIGDRKEPYIYTNQAYKSESGKALLFVEFQNPESNRKQAIHKYDYKRADIKEGFEFNISRPRIPGKRYLNNQPMDDWVQMPLFVGKKYSVRDDWASGEGNNKYDAEVETYEKVKVEAGEFDVYRIKLSGWWTRTSEGSGSGKAECTLWFSPAAKRVIKRYYFDRFGSATWNANLTELVKWEPRAALPDFLESKAKAPNNDASAPVSSASAPQ